MSKATPINQIPGTETAFSSQNRVWGIGSTLNGGIDFGESTQTDPSNYTGNMNGQWVNITTPSTPNTEFAVPYFLGVQRIASFYLYNLDRAGDLYQLPDTGTPWTNSNIYLRCSVASAKARIFIQ
jgi:hypothetical protein